MKKVYLLPPVPNRPAPEIKKESVFMQMHNGRRTGEGSFNVGLKELFYKADIGNRCKLVKAFPYFFGDEVPEFGITRQMFNHNKF